MRIPPDLIGDRILINGPYAKKQMVKDEGCNGNHLLQWSIDPLPLKKKYSRHTPMALPGNRTNENHLQTHLRSASEDWQ